jgi:3-oxoacyl-[acyl-carrier-protein] synthase-3
MRASIVGLGEWRPETVRTNDAWPSDFAERAAAAGDRELAEVTAGSSGDELDTIVARYIAAESDDPLLGTKQRRVAAADVTSSDAEARAARAALEDAGIEPKDVDLVMSTSFTPDLPVTGNAPRVAHLIGATEALAFTADAACASIPIQLTAAAAWIESGRARTVLLTQSHLATRTFPFAHPASPNIGDVATSIVVRASEQPGILSTFAISHGEYFDAVVWRRAKEADVPWFEAGGPMFLGSRDRDAARRLIRDTVRLGRDTVTEAAKRSGVALHDIDVLASVQPRRWVPGAIAEALGLRPKTAPVTFDELAHLGQCGPAANLLEARRRGMFRPREPGVAPLVCIYAQGMGFTRAATVLRWTA